MIVTEKSIKKIISQEVDQRFAALRQEIAAYAAKELDPKKYYVLIVPPDVDIDAVRDAFEPFSGKINLVVLQAENVKLLEIG